MRGAGTGRAPYRLAVSRVTRHADRMPRGPLFESFGQAKRGRGGRADSREPLWVALLLAVHLALALWGVAANSVTFDENFHLPAGVMILARGDYSVSLAQPPLLKSLCALAALGAGARVPTLPAL